MEFINKKFWISILVPVAALLFPLFTLSYNMGQTNQKVTQLCEEYIEHRKEHENLNNRLLDIVQKITYHDEKINYYRHK